MSAPPPALDCAHVLEYAIVDATVQFEQRRTLNVGGEWLGEVPRLAVCQNFDEAEFMVFHCDSDWNVLGVAAGYNSADEARAATERSYHGLSSKWQPSRHSREEAILYVTKQFKDQECSFCGRFPLQYRCVIGDAVRICNHCVDEFHETIHRESGET